MKKYLCTVPLKYKNESSVTPYDQEMRYTLDIKETILEKITFKFIFAEDLEVEEKSTITLYTEGKVVFLKVSFIYADDKQFAVEFLEKILKSVLPKLVYIIQSKNHNKHLFQFNLTYSVTKFRIHEVPYEKFEEYKQQKMREENEDEVVIRVNDRLNLEEFISSEIIQTPTLEDYSSVKLAVHSSLFIKQLLDSYVRALGDEGNRSKYFNLFVIIEALENFHKNDVAIQLLSEQEIDELMTHLKKADNSIISGGKIPEIENRVKNTLNSITKDSRKRKLLKILKEILGISEIQRISTMKPINQKFVSEIINQRNSLFHAKDLNESEEEKLGALVLDLTILCEKIIAVLIEKQLSSRDF